MSVVIKPSLWLIYEEKTDFEYCSYKVPRLVMAKAWIRVRIYLSKLIYTVNILWNDVVGVYLRMLLLGRPYFHWFCIEWYRECSLNQCNLYHFLLIFVLSNFLYMDTQVFTIFAFIIPIAL